MDETPQQPRRPQDHDEPQAEVLEQGRGGPIAAQARTRRPAALVAGLGVLGLGLVGGAAFGAYWYLSDGAQAAEAFPADSVGYVGVTLDPSGQQKLAALQTAADQPQLQLSSVVGLEPLALAAAMRAFYQQLFRSGGALVERGSKSASVTARPA